MDVVKPLDARQAGETIAWAAAERKTVEIVGGASKRRLGRPIRADVLLDASGLNGIIDYEPAELVLTARAATPMKEIHAQLAAAGQILAFEPPDWRGLLGAGGEPTLGGILACNLAGPRRLRAGAARDFFLGFSAVNGRGETFKAGGKVVKNVTGYDLCKLMAGSYGTLSLLTEVTIKVAPRAESACTLLLPGIGDEEAVALMARALNTPYEVSAAAHLPAACAERSGIEATQGAVTVLRLEGPKPSIAFRAEALENIFGRGSRLDDDQTARFWSDIAEVAPLRSQDGRCIWRLCPPPSEAAKVAAQISSHFASADYFYDWGGGLIWVSLDAADAGADAGAALLRATLKSCGGHALLVAADEELRAKVDVFEPEPAALAAVSRKVKSGFDPAGVLNPGRMREGL